MAVIYSKARKPARASVTVKEKKCTMQNAECTMPARAPGAKPKKEKKDGK